MWMPGTTLSITNGSFKYRAEAENIALTEVEFKAKEGQLIAIIGSTGSGKTTLLNAILGDLHKVSGEVTVTVRSRFTRLTVEAAK